MKALEQKTMSSLEIAELTEKQHSHVLRDIRRMVEQFEAAIEANPNLDWHCVPSSYLDSQGKAREMFELDKDTSVTLLAGYDAVARLKIVKRWQELEREKQSPTLSQLDVLMQSVQILQRQERELAEVKAVQAEQGEAIRQLDARTQTRPDYFTVAGYANLNRITIGLKMASSVGQRASQICKARGYPMEQCPDPRFGTVNMYPSPVLREVFSQPI